MGIAAPAGGHRRSKAGRFVPTWVSPHARSSRVAAVEDCGWLVLVWVSPIARSSRVAAVEDCGWLVLVWVSPIARSSCVARRSRTCGPIRAHVGNAARAVIAARGLPTGSSPRLSHARSSPLEDPQAGSPSCESRRATGHRGLVAIDDVPPVRAHVGIAARAVIACRGRGLRLVSARVVSPIARSSRVAAVEDCGWLVLVWYRRSRGHRVSRGGRGHADRLVPTSVTPHGRSSPLEDYRRVRAHDCRTRGHRRLKTHRPARPHASLVAPRGHRGLVAIDDVPAGSCPPGYRRMRGHRRLKTHRPARPHASLVAPRGHVAIEDVPPVSAHVGIAARAVMSAMGQLCRADPPQRSTTAVTSAPQRAPNLPQPIDHRREVRRQRRRQRYPLPRDRMLEP